jgi:hypothetical protein
MIAQQAPAVEIKLIPRLLLWVKVGLDFFDQIMAIYVGVLAQKQFFLPILLLQYMC